MSFADWTGWPPDTYPVGTLDVGGLPGRVPVGPTDADSDGDGVPDTVVVESGDTLSLFTDLDGDLLADQEVRLGPPPQDPAPDPARSGDPWWDALGDLVDAALGR